MTEIYKGFTLSTANDWTTITGPDGRVFARVRGVSEARYWVDVYVQQNGEPGAIPA